MNHAKAADLIEEVSGSLGRNGLLEPGTIRSLAHLGAGAALHDVTMRIFDRFGTQRSVSVRNVLRLVADVQLELDERKAAQEARAG